MSVTMTKRPRDLRRHARPSDRFIMPTRTLDRENVARNFRSFTAAWLFHFAGTAWCERGLRVLAPVYRENRRLEHDGVTFIYLNPHE